VGGSKARLLYKRKNIMAKKLQFKAPHGRLVSQEFGEITNENLTRELYNKLVAQAEGHKELFEEVEEMEVKPKKVIESKPKQNDVQA
jgi:hypothetical protein